MRPHLLLIVGFATALSSACRKETAPSPATTGTTAVQNEMRLLHEAMRSSVTAVANGTLDSIPESLHTVHRARELTEKALESGEYKLPKNPEKLATFKELDEQFHGELEKLVAVATSKDGAATGSQVGVVLSKCPVCHAQFRPASTGMPSAAASASLAPR